MLSCRAMTIAELKAFRQRHDLTQQGLADLLGITRNAINLMEMGERPIMHMTELALDSVRRKLQLKKKRRKPK